jgi:alkylhydroperoxidase family enzyme
MLKARSPFRALAKHRTISPPPPSRQGDEQRLYLLTAWRECPFYTECERAALAWTEALTLLSESNVPDDVFALARTQFSEQELVKLTLAIVAINGANRINVAFRTVPGSYQPAVRGAAE